MLSDPYLWSTCGFEVQVLNVVKVEIIALIEFTTITKVTAKAELYQRHIFSWIYSYFVGRI